MTVKIEILKAIQHYFEVSCSIKSCSVAIIVSNVYFCSCKKFNIQFVELQNSDIKNISIFNT